jgi:hypothetical protein
MEVIKKTILQITKFVITGGTGSTKVILSDGYYTKPEDVYLGWTGATSGTGYTKIVDTGITYNVKICLTQESEDIGFFDAYIITEPVIPPIPPVPIDTNYYVDYDEIVFTDSDGDKFI